MDITTVAVSGQALNDSNLIKQALGDSSDVIFRHFQIGKQSRIPAVLVYIDGLVNRDVLHDHLMRSLMLFTLSPDSNRRGEALLEAIKQRCIAVAEAKEFRLLGEGINHVLSGDTVLLVESAPAGLVLNTRGWEHRSINEPSTEAVVRGPKESFTEVLRVNTSLIRRRVKDPGLRFKATQVGRRSRTDVVIAYIEGLANPGLLEELQRRLACVNLDGVLDSGVLEQLLEDAPMSPFPQMEVTERPDSVAAALLQGRLAVLVDGSPFVLLVPAVLWSLYCSPEDYYQRWVIASFVRFIRQLALFLSLLMPSIYIAIISYHPEMLPLKLSLAVANSRAGVPFPAAVEALLMEVSVEVLREAALRLPGPIGPTVGIVGVLVVGDAAVKAQLASAQMVVVVGLTAIGSFASPSYSAAVGTRLLRFPMMLLAGTLGFYGVMLGIIALTIHLASLDSLGVPYSAPYAPASRRLLSDTLVRLPLWKLKRRPEFFKPLDQSSSGKQTSAYEAREAVTRSSLEGQDEVK